ncbi:MAG: dUTP diphosphatase [Patescibacteria group bacterium]
MNIPIRRFDPDVPLPEYKTDGAAAMDCYVREDVTIQPGSIGYASLNFALQVPPGHFTMLAARSSLHKRGLMMGNGIGILDEDYCGNDDEFRAVLYNFTDEPVEVKRGERIVQIVILPFDKVTLTEVERLGNESRGGLGTTGL